MSVALLSAASRLAIGADDTCSHVALLRQIADRLEAIGGPAAKTALDELAESTEAHLRTVEMVIAITEALENTAAIH